MTRTFMIAAVLTVGTTFAAQAMGCNKHQQAMSCAEGTTYDSATHTCVPITTG